MHSYLQDFNNYSVIAVDVDGLKHFTVFASSELSYKLVVILVAE